MMNIYMFYTFLLTSVGACRHATLGACSQHIYLSPCLWKGVSHRIHPIPFLKHKHKHNTQHKDAKKTKSVYILINLQLFFSLSFSSPKSIFLISLLTADTAIFQRWRFLSKRWRALTSKSRWNLKIRLVSIQFRLFLFCFDWIVVFWCGIGWELGFCALVDGLIWSFAR